MQIEINLNKTVEENAGTYFNLAKKAKKKLKGAKEALEKTKQELEKLKQQ
ncbi:MAG: NFACT family protein, partial [Nanoarchaeota archaeon]|nr:NFACT family protein [Nanoarchaeota archaeon]